MFPTTGLFHSAVSYRPRSTHDAISRHEYWKLARPLDSSTPLISNHFLGLERRAFKNETQRPSTIEGCSGLYSYQIRQRKDRGKTVSEGRQLAPATLSE